ncbi:FAD-dependent monooxygenase [Pseudonocardia sp. KRD-291]|nr:FAD-dependent monooxygenase [Pseudonocardia sp. KRD291]
MRVAIVGGGIGGLAAAGALVGRGIDVTVHERATGLGEIGAGVFVTPNSVRLLERMGLGGAIAAAGARVGDGSSYYRKDGALVAPILTTDSSGEIAAFGMHRADLLGLLADALPEGTVHTGKECVGFRQDTDGAEVEFADGSSVGADVVVAADGINSNLRGHVVEPRTAVHSGSVAYRGLIDAERLPWWTPGVSQLWMGEGKHFLVYPVRGGAQINYVGFVPSDEQTTESWSAPGDPAKLAAAFADWDPRIVGLLDEVEEAFWWGLYDREPLDRWSEGRLTLLGDAAHPMLPHLGQGANQSVEDGVALAVLLAAGGREGVEAALQAYEELRRERTSAIQLGARANGRRYDSAYPDLRDRDAEIAASATFRLWLYDYDSQTEAEAVARTLKTTVAAGRRGRATRAEHP